MKVAICSACGKTDAQRAHVRDRASFDPEYRNHDFYNIIHLCAYCHHRYFDEGLMAILIDEQKFLVLINIARREIEEREFTQKISVKQEFIDWKNERCHSYLEAEMRKRRLANAAVEKASTKSSGAN